MRDGPAGPVGAGPGPGKKNPFSKWVGFEYEKI